MKKNKKNIGFTLVEMLVVIAIIGILMGMVIPSLSKAQKHARKVECLSNLRQLYMGAVSHANDVGDRGRFPAACSAEYYDVVTKYWYHGWTGHTGWVNWAEENYQNHKDAYDQNPPGDFKTYWWGAKGETSIRRGTIYPYIRDMRVYICPAFKRYVKTEGDKSFRDPKRSYVMNAHVGGYRFFDMQKLGMSRRLLFADGAYAAKSYKDPRGGTVKATWGLKDDGDHVIQSPRRYCYFRGCDGMLEFEYDSKDKQIELIGDWHNGKGNVVFLDGHTETLEPYLTQDICTGDYEPGKK